MSPSSEAPRGRLRFDGVARTPTQDGHETIRVGLEWNGAQHAGESMGVQTREGDIRTAAMATLEATRAVLGDEGPDLDLIGVKAVRAFDAFVVIVSVDIRSEGDRQRVLGAQACTDSNLVRSSAIATLDALNRLLERYLR